ncbi:ABC transporter substrate-binding protein [Streptomyces sp. NBRC 110611]|uniref:ABC transporter substrate-binding protein n=1 Tax=Streptomyces sp. NBRC 110611 TaxID=1621259 RepID=UPI000857CCB3|nr:ABC transporter substrate-binding protein [Streptomyces sp. NBRC 110611]GAU71260.1 ABC transporter substrate-binding protein [Streptomyces sp. NBRC 110611]
MTRGRIRQPVPRTLPRTLSAGLLAAGILMTTGCGAEVEPTAKHTHDTVTVSNCGQDTTYTRPKRPVAYDISGAEKMFSLGLGGRMRGYVMNKLGDPAIKGSPWRKDYAKVERLGTERITREIVVDAKADWVLAGWNSGFSEERGITPALLKKVGVASYLHTETCWDYGNKSVDVTPLEALYTDLTNLGQIFGVEQRADKLVTDLKNRVATLKKTWPDKGGPARVFVYDSGTDQPFTTGRHAAPDDIITAAGGTNVFHALGKGWTAVGWEPVIKARPEVVVIVDYADQPAQDKIAYVKSLPRLKSVPAVKNNRFFVMSIGDAVSGPRNVTAAENLGHYLRSIGR